MMTHAGRKPLSSALFPRAPLTEYSSSKALLDILKSNISVNGAGKSTLFKIIAEGMDYDGGDALNIQLDAYMEEWESLSQTLTQM